MSKLIDSAMIELSPEQLSTLTKTMRLLLEHPENKEIRDRTKVNLTILSKYLPILIKNKKYSKEQVKGFRDVYEMFKELYRNGYKHRYYGILQTLMKSRSLLEDMLEIMSMKEFEELCTVQNLNSEEIDIDKIFVVRKEGKDYFVDKYDNGYKPLKRFHGLKNAQNYADYMTGFTERLHEFKGLNASLFRDETKEKDISIWRAKGRDDAESTVLSSAIGRDNIRKDTHVNINERFFENLVRMNEERKILNKKQILDIINENRKDKNRPEIEDLSKELLEKTEEGTSLGALLERISNGIILNEKKRDRQI